MEVFQVKSVLLLTMSTVQPELWPTASTAGNILSVDPHTPPLEMIPSSV